MFEGLKQFFVGKPGPKTNFQLFDNEETRTFLTSQQLPDWTEEVISFNSGWSSVHKGFLIVVVNSHPTNKTQ